MPTIEFYDRSSRDTAMDILSESDSLVRLSDGSFCASDDAVYVESDGEYYPINDCTSCYQCNGWVLDNDTVSSNHTQESFCSSNCRDEWEANNVELEEEEVPPQPSGVLRGYHSQCRNIDNSGTSPYCIGFEIEKEDADIRQQILDGSITLPPGWLIERDGSLDGVAGFEIITRGYSFDHWDTMKRDFESASAVLNAKASKRCGGHISVSDADKGATTLAKELSVWMPLLYAMYPARCNNNYCRAIRLHMVGSTSRYAITSFGSDLGSRVEFRIFPKVKNAAMLLRRATLLCTMCHESTALNEMPYPERLERIMDLTKPIFYGNTYNADTWDELRKRTAAFSSWFYAGSLDIGTIAYTESVRPIQQFVP